jgi:hypothetical protein
MRCLSSMKNGRFHPPKCRGKVKKMGMLYTLSTKMSGPSTNTKKKKKKKKHKKLEKKRGDMGQPVV